MSVHKSHTDISKRLKRANGHLNKIIEMIADERPCLDLAQQLHAVEKAIHSAKAVLIQDHIDHCLEHSIEGKKGAHAALKEFKEITKYL
ncbi:MAG: metal-sensing transcriptional repressor [Alphaproteobacteria bacterium]